MGANVSVNMMKYIISRLETIRDECEGALMGQNPKYKHLWIFYEIVHENYLRNVLHRKTTVPNKPTIIGITGGSDTKRRHLANYLMNKMTTYSDNYICEYDIYDSFLPKCASTAEFCFSDKAKRELMTMNGSWQIDDIVDHMKLMTEKDADYFSRDLLGITIPSKEFKCILVPDVKTHGEVNMIKSVSGRYLFLYINSDENNDEEELEYDIKL